MKITIEIPSFYHEEGNWVKYDCADEVKTLTPVPVTDKAQIILLNTCSDRECFAAEMTDIIESKLNEMSDEYKKENAHLEKCYDL